MEVIPTTLIVIGLINTICVCADKLILTSGRLASYKLFQDCWRQLETARIPDLPKIMARQSLRVVDIVMGKRILSKRGILVPLLASVLLTSMALAVAVGMSDFVSFTMFLGELTGRNAFAVYAVTCVFGGLSAVVAILMLRSILRASAWATPFLVSAGLVVAICLAVGGATLLLRVGRSFYPGSLWFNLFSSIWFHPEFVHACSATILLPMIGCLVALAMLCIGKALTGGARRFARCFAAKSTVSEAGNFKPFTFLGVLLSVVAAILGAAIELAPASSRPPPPTMATFSLGGDVGLDMVRIPGGVFTMGSPETEDDRVDDEVQHEVQLGGYWLGRFEVTQAQYEAVMGSNRSYHTNGLSRPVERVSWDDAVAFCEKLNEMSVTNQALAGLVFGLPTEAQWEYACRAGTTTATAFGDRLASYQANFDYDRPYRQWLADACPMLFGWLRGRRETMSVGSFSPNGWGLYDMHGNVWEWCRDWYGEYPQGRMVDPSGSGEGSLRVVVRGGSGWSFAGYCRSACRGADGPVIRLRLIGFRLAAVQGKAGE